MPNYQEVLNRLQNDYGMKDRGKFYREGKCPKCDKKTLWISATEPNHIKCGRENNCDWSSKTRDLYPELWKPLHELHPPTRDNPKATANAYLRSRKLDPVLFNAEFDQGQRIEREAIRDPKFTETVRFYLTADKATWWERLIIPIETGEGVKKAHFNRSYKGQMWKHSQFNPEKGDQVFLTEGVLDALSLIQSGFKAVSLMSSNHWPEQALEPYFDKGIRWVIALDNDKAGQYYSRKYFKELQRRGEQVEVCTAPDQDKRDWNDLLKECGGKIRRHDMDKWFYAGRLLTASSASEKALEIIAHTQRSAFPFEFGDQLYMAKHSNKEGEEPLKITKIANCNPTFRYFQKDAVTDEGSYFINVTRPKQKREYKGVVSSKAISSGSEFKQRLLNLGAGLTFTGSTKQLEYFQDELWWNGNRPEVYAVNFIGYAKEFNGWVFPKQAVFNGKLYQVNKDDFFDLPEGKQVKTSFRQDDVTIGNIEDAHRPEKWLNDFKTAFGIKGLATLAYWSGSFFAEHIRAMPDQKSYPFLELSGEPGTGKSTLLEFMWKLSGRDNYEGIELTKATPATRWRSLEQLANLPLVAIEGDRSDSQGHQRRTFDLSEAKPLYNGRGMRGTSYKNQGNETKEPPFRGALVIAQNAPVESEKAVMERIVQLHWDKSHFSDEGYEASTRLNSLDMEEINGFITACIAQEKTFITKYREGYQVAIKRLDTDTELGNRRIRHNHAQIMALAHALRATGILKGLTPADLEELDSFLQKACLNRHKCLDEDTPLVTEFWDTYNYLEHETRLKQNHSKNPALIAISLNQFIGDAAELRQRPFDMVQLRKELKQSKQCQFIDNKPVDSAIKKGNGKVSCFVFHQPAKQQQQFAQAA